MTLNNLIEKYDADCWDMVWISLPGMMFFTGWTLGSLLLPALGDKYGRKILYVPTLCITFSSMVTIVLLPGLNIKWFYVLIAVFFINGVSNGGRSTSGYCLMVEIAPLKYQNFMGTVWNMSEGMVYIYLTIYYRYISKNWVWTLVFGASL